MTIQTYMHHIQVITVMVRVIYTIPTVNRPLIHRLSRSTCITYGCSMQTNMLSVSTQLACMAYFYAVHVGLNNHRNNILS